MEVTNYITEDGSKPFAEWIKGLNDGNARMRINARITRIRATGNFGDAKAIGDGVYELKIDYGLGYRVYFAKSGNEIVLLLCGGIKKRQTEDIKQAKKYWSEYKTRTKRGK